MAIFLANLGLIIWIEYAWSSCDSGEFVLPHSYFFLIFRFWKLLYIFYILIENLSNLIARILLWGKPYPSFRVVISRIQQNRANEKFRHTNEKFNINNLSSTPILINL